MNANEIVRIYSSNFKITCGNIWSCREFILITNWNKIPLSAITEKYKFLNYKRFLGFAIAHEQAV